MVATSLIVVLAIFSFVSCILCVICVFFTIHNAKSRNLGFENGERIDAVETKIRRIDGTLSRINDKLGKGGGGSSVDDAVAEILRQSLLNDRNQEQDEWEDNDGDVDANR